MRLSVACNFDEELIDGLRGFPVYEVYGKVTSDYAGGGRPSFYLPQVGKPEVEATLQRAREACGGPLWKKALALLREAGERSTLDKVVEQHLEHFAALERAASNGTAR